MPVAQATAIRWLTFRCKSRKGVRCHVVQAVSLVQEHFRYKNARFHMHRYCGKFLFVSGRAVLGSRNSLPRTLGGTRPAHQHDGQSRHKGWKPAAEVRPRCWVFGNARRGCDDAHILLAAGASWHYSLWRNNDKRCKPQRSRHCAIWLLWLLRLLCTRRRATLQLQSCGCKTCALENLFGASLVVYLCTNPPLGFPTWNLEHHEGMQLAKPMYAFRFRLYSVLLQTQFDFLVRWVKIHGL